MFDFNPEECRLYTKLSTHVQKHRTVEGLTEENKYTYERCTIAANIMRYAMSGLPMMEHQFTNGIDSNGEHSIASGLHYLLEEEGFTVKRINERKLLISWQKTKEE